jgi:HSP20 family molecular chaperone IbpA
MTLSRLSTISSKSGPVRSFCNHHHRNLPETYFGSASNIFKIWEKEFERMQQQFDNYFRDLKNNQPITNYSPYLENDLIITESDGSRKFHLSLNTHGFGPEDIKIKTQNGTLTISARKEGKVKFLLL